VIVVDDCSTDGSLGLIKDLNNEFVIIKHKHNSGVAVASNTGLYAASGDYWMRVDADDYLSLMALQYMSSILDANSEIGFVYSDHLRIDSSIDKPKRIRLNSIEKLLNHGAGVLFRRDLLLEIGGYDKSLRNGEDFELMCTNPMKTVEDIDASIEKLISTGADSVIAIHQLEDHHPARIKKIVDDKIVDFCIPEIPESRRQDLKPEAYIRSGSIYALKRNYLMIEGKRYGSDNSRPYILPQERAVNIDTEVDFIVAELMLNK